MSTAEAARELIEAREAELEPTLELDPDG
jgi:hypothetical protein